VLWLIKINLENRRRPGSKLAASIKAKEICACRMRIEFGTPPWALLGQELKEVTAVVDSPAAQM